MVLGRFPPSDWAIRYFARQRFRAAVPNNAVRV